MSIPTPWQLFGVETGPGWAWIVVALMQAAQDRGDVGIIQVKEKFGGLRFYYVGGDEAFDDLVSEGERVASQTCEQCGATPATLRTGGWMQTLCDDHGEDRPTAWPDI